MLASLVRPPEFHQVQLEKSQDTGVPRVFIRGLYRMIRIVLLCYCAVSIVSVIRNVTKLLVAIDLILVLHDISTFWFIE